MQDIGSTILATAISVVITLVVTFIFNKLVALPAAIRRDREAQQAEINNMRTELNEQKDLVATLKTAIDALPTYRQQSLNIQHELQENDRTLVATCEAIRSSVNTLSLNTEESVELLQQSMVVLKEGQDEARRSLLRLEKREKNALRLKIIAEYQIFASLHKNPEKAWSEMEHHAFFALVHDYEDLGGNDYIHSTVLPAMNELEVVPMENLARLEEVMQARQQK